MSSHYAAIGFHEETLEALADHLALAAERGNHAAFSPGHGIVRWQDRSGAALFAHVSGGDLVGATPAFWQAEPREALVEAVVPDLENSFDGTVRVFLTPGPAVLLPVDVANWAVTRSLLHPQAVCALQVTAFAESCRTFDGEDDYRATHPEEAPQRPSWVAPTGLFPEDKGGTGRATAMIKGTARSPRILVNGLSGGVYHHFRLELSDGPMDVVGAGDSPPTEGTIVRGHFWLCGIAGPLA